MSKTSLAEKIVSIRKCKGLSQEELAGNASINLRTLQRIENGETQPRGHTLQLIARGLGVSVESLYGLVKEEDKGFLQLMNLSTLSFWILPLGNIFLPLVLWYIKKDKVKGVGELGRRIINFQITWSLVTFGFFLVCTAGAIIHPPGMPLWFPFYIMILPGIVVLCIINSALILIAGFQINRGVEKVYSIGLRIIR